MPQDDNINVGGLEAARIADCKAATMGPSEDIGAPTSLDILVRRLETYSISIVSFIALVFWLVVGGVSLADCYLFWFAVCNNTADSHRALEIVILHRPVAHIPIGLSARDAVADGIDR